MENIGYETHNTILNLSTLYFVIMLYIIKLLIFGITHISKQRQNKVYRTMKDNLIWSELLTISIEGFMELYISGYLEYSYPLDTKSGEVKAKFFGNICLVHSLFIFPSILIWVQIQEKSTLNEFLFKQTYGVLYDGINLSNTWTQSFYLIFTIRRFIFISLGLFLFNYPIF